MADIGGWAMLPRDVTGDLPASAHAVSLHVYQRQVIDGHLTAIIARELLPGDSEPVWHLSVSHRTNAHPPQPGRRPRRPEISEAKRRFLPDISTTTEDGEQPHIIHVWERP